MHLKSRIKIEPDYSIFSEHRFDSLDQMCVQ